MKWYENLFVGDDITDSIDYIKKNIFDKKMCKNLFLIIYPANDKNLLEIIKAQFVKEITWRDIEVLGLAASKTEAEKLIKRIITLVYNETGSFAIKEYFNRHDSGNSFNND